MAKKWADPLGPHARIYHSLLNSAAWRALSFSSKALFVDLRGTVTATNNGNITAAMSVMKHKGWTSRTTLARGLYELRVLGFIAVTVEGGLRQGTRVPSLYRFTDLDVFEQPKVGVQAIKATHDYRSFESVREAEQALVVGLERLQEQGRKKQQTKKKPHVQKMDPSSPDSGLEHDFSSPVSVH
jgi:hypothetical protein